MYPEVGSRWIHYKTKGVYEVIAIGMFTEHPSEMCVVYRSVDDLNKVWIRPFDKIDIHDNRSCWNDIIDEYGNKRFQLITN